MTLIQEEHPLTMRALLARGLPACALAILLSTVTHHAAHILADHSLWQGGSVSLEHAVRPFEAVSAGTEGISAISSFAGTAWTFLLALSCFAWSLHAPRNLFAASMALVNASARIPEVLTVFLQLLFHSQRVLVTDESLSLSLLRVKDPTLGVAFMCFFTLTLASLACTIVHNATTVPRKWLVALVLFLLLLPLENLIWRLVGPLVSFLG